MAPTLLEFLDDSYKFSSLANVVKTDRLPDGKFSIVLNKTIFYPQGGGQPFDTGTIHSANSRFIVNETRFNEGMVFHIGEFENGNFSVNESVELNINQESRILHCKLHSAGHLVDVAMANSGFTLQATKGYHFSNGSYVEYAGDIPMEFRNGLCHKLSEEMKKLISEGGPVNNFIVETKEDLYTYCDFVPEYLPRDKPIRIVTIAGHHCPCGGTHVKNIKELGEVIVTKIKVKAGNVRVSYELAIP